MLFSPKETVDITTSTCNKLSRGTAAPAKRWTNRIVCSEIPRRSASKAWWGFARRGMSVISARVSVRDPTSAVLDHLRIGEMFWYEDRYIPRESNKVRVKTVEKQEKDDAACSDRACWNDIHDRNECGSRVQEEEEGATAGRRGKGGSKMKITGRIMTHSRAPT